ncbi:MAG: hypothetical protein AMS23_10295 [Bacteroides sp. SM1_62]|nr:MAG: hypothetical protein AMS26_06930 [Bacteroides sp. SM23_62]KPL20841.1 MAG: hypothetical protein AMS23_10295 [Bacteroides sp. SM1_62]
MPLGGGDIGCNVWVEDGNILLYLSRSGTFDENNTMLKLGRIRIILCPNPFQGKDSEFRQELKLREGCIFMMGKNQDLSATLKLWVEVYRPEIHIQIKSSTPVEVEAHYESWRTEDRPVSKNERMQCLSFLDTEPEKIPLTTYKDSVITGEREILWYHSNRDDDLVFDKEVTQQHLDDIRGKLWNPMKKLTFGGLIRGDGMSFSHIVRGRYLDNDYMGWVLKSNEAQDYLVKKMLYKSQRFPAFWDTGNVKAGIYDFGDFDQCPDFDHGGAGMINLQEMLLQTNGKEIRILPSWPEEWDVDFKVHVPYNTVIKGHFNEGIMVDLEVTPGSRRDDIVIKK